MVFGAILGLAGSVIGGIASGNAAKRQAQAAERDAQLRRQTEQEQLGLARDQFDFGKTVINREFQRADFADDQFRRNAALELAQRNYGRSITDENRRIAASDRQFDINRQGQLDQRAQAEYDRRRSEIENNRLITGNERERALQELEIARQTAIRERQFDVDQLTRDQGIAASERDFGIEQLMRARDTADAERQFKINELRNNQSISESERQTALDALYAEQEQARQERAEDEMRLREAQSGKQDERAFQLAEYQRARQQALDERNYDIGQRQTQMDAINRMTGALESAYSSLGPLDPTRTLGQADIDAEAARREQVASDDFNRIIDRTASTNEANLIRSGIDQATPATDARSAVASQLAPQLAQLRENARSEAIKYVAGVNDQLRLPAELEMARRQSILRDVQSTYAPGVDAMRGLLNVRSANEGPQFNAVDTGVYDRNVQSATGVRGPLQVGSGVFQMDVGSANDFRAPVNIGTSIVNRNVGSANDFRSPIDINSGVYSSGEASLGTGMADNFDVSRTNLVNPYDNSGAYQYNPASIPSGSNIMGNAGSMFSGVLNSANNQANNSQNRAVAAANQAGGAIGGALTKGADFLGGVLDRTFAKKSSAPGQVDSSFWANNGYQG
jgi:hypothetical protein